MAVDGSQTLRVLVVGDDPLARSGLVGALSTREDVTVVGDSPSDLRLDEAVELLAPDALVWDLGADAADAAEFLNEFDVPVLALLDDPGLAPTVLESGADGVLMRDGDGDRMAAALAAIVHNVVVLDAAFLPVLIPQRHRPGASPPEPLTSREREVLTLLAEGLSNRTIAEALAISEHTAKFHVNAILSKLDARTRTEAVVVAARLGLLHL